MVTRTYQVGGSEAEESVAKADDPLLSTKDDHAVAVQPSPAEKPLLVSREPEVLDSKKRSVGLISAIALIVGTMIGSGIFVSPSGLLKRTESVGLCLLVWALSGILAMLGALSYCELGTIVPKSGGEVAYLMEAFGNMHPFFGPLPSFLFAWVTAMLLKPATVAIICMAFAEYTLSPFIEGVDEEWYFGPYYMISVKLLAIVCIFLVCFINCYSAVLATRVQVVFTVAKLAAVAVIISGGFIRIFQGHTAVLATGFSGTSNSPGNIASSFYGGLFAYDGWNCLNFITEELINPHQNLPRAILIGMPLVTVSYVLVNMAYLTAMTKAQMIASAAVAVDFGDVVLGRVALLIPISVALSTFGAANGMELASGRISYAASREGQLASILSHVNVHKLTPTMGLIFNALIAILMVIPGNIGSLIDFFSFTAWIFYALAMAALVRLRFTKKDVYRPYKVPIVFPIIVMLVSMYLVVAPIIDQPAAEYLYACMFILMGVVYYYPFVYKGWSICGKNNKVTRLVQLIFLVAPEPKTKH